MFSVLIYGLTLPRVLMLWGLYLGFFHFKIEQNSGNHKGVYKCFLKALNNCSKLNPGVLFHFVQKNFARLRVSVFVLYNSEDKAPKTEKHNILKLFSLYRKTLPIAKILSVKNVRAWVSIRPSLNGFIFKKINEK